MSRRRTWLTKSGVEVYADGYEPAVIRGRRVARAKIIAYRVATGGFHGVLWLKNLREAAR